MATQEYKFGLHKDQLYELNTTRTVFHPLSGVKPNFWPLVSNAAMPQIQAEWLPPSRVFVPEPGIQGAVPAYIKIPPQYDLTPGSLVFTPQPAPQGRVPPVTQGAPQLLDMTQQGSIFRPTPASQGPVPPIFLGAPQLLDMTQQASFFSPIPGIQGSVPPLQTAYPQIDLTPLGFLSKPFQQPVITSGFLGAFIQIAPQQYDATLPAAFYKPALSIQAKVPPIIMGSPQILDLTINGVFIKAATSTHAVATNVPHYEINLGLSLYRLGGHTY